MSNNLREYISLDLGECDNSMSVTAFVGGEHGSGVQFTIGNTYCALAENQLKDLITVLKKRLANKKYHATSRDLEVVVKPKRRKLK